MAGRVSTWQKLGMIVVVACLGWGIWHLYLWREWASKFNRWQTEVPLRVRLSVGLDGEYAAVFTQTCEIAHAQRLSLEPVDPADQARLLAAAKSVHVTGSVAAVDREWAKDLTELEPAESECGVASARITPPPPDGPCRLQCTVTGGVAAEGVGQVDLVMRHELCGLEAMPGVIHAGLGILAMTIGGVLALVVLATIAGGRSRPAQATPWQPT